MTLISNEMKRVVIVAIDKNFVVVHLGQHVSCLVHVNWVAMSLLCPPTEKIKTRGGVKNKDSGNVPTGYDVYRDPSYFEHVEREYSDSQGTSKRVCTQLSQSSQKQLSQSSQKQLSQTSKKQLSQTSKNQQSQPSQKQLSQPSKKLTSQKYLMSEIVAFEMTEIVASEMAEIVDF
ncbi:hypothetical protein L195_g030848 [Trifolium pratense]|uniref:Uncharacterized protein n=1 Tax=Trifolium pratense TaxID=57577 RepID=A0A2K3L8Q6_TRIPR|nr:hypothetical protein L195_g030848 [Trifolium pratense]